MYNCTFVIIWFNCYHWGYWREKWLVHRHQLFHKQIQILFVLARRSRWMNIRLRIITEGMRVHFNSFMTHLVYLRISKRIMPISGISVISLEFPISRFISIPILTLTSYCSHSTGITTVWKSQDQIRNLNSALEII